jgi:hypothetical protein
VCRRPFSSSSISDDGHQSSSEAASFSSVRFVATTSRPLYATAASRQHAVLDGCVWSVQQERTACSERALGYKCCPDRLGVRPDCRRVAAPLMRDIRRQRRFDSCWVAVDLTASPWSPPRTIGRRLSIGDSAGTFLLRRIADDQVFDSFASGRNTMTRTIQRADAEKLVKHGYLMTMRAADCKRCMSPKRKEIAPRSVTTLPLSLSLSLSLSLVSLSTSCVPSERK